MRTVNGISLVYFGLFLKELSGVLTHLVKQQLIFLEPLVKQICSLSSTTKIIDYGLFL